MNMKKRVLSLVLSAALLLSCAVLVQPQAAKAAELPTVSVMHEVTMDVLTAHFGKDAPEEKPGYMFAGWYAQVGQEPQVVIRKLTDEILKEEGVKILAKYIASHMTRVSCQITAGTFDGTQTAEKTNMRIVSLIDSKSYRAVGFNLYRQTWNEAEGKFVEKPFSVYDPTNPTDHAAQSTKKYNALRVYNADGATYKDVTPKEIFGDQAADFFFTTVRINNIPSSAYENCIIVIRPYWITLDGTYVEGVGKYIRVADSRDGITNITVDLKQAADIAAGKLSIQYPEGYTYKDWNTGRVFEEMTVVHDEANRQIHCIGNVADIRQDAADPSDIFINLRFAKEGNAATGTSIFEILSGFQFANRGEELVTDLDIPNVIH